MSLPRFVILVSLSLATLSLLGPAKVLAAPPNGIGVGPRIEDGVPGIGIDYWTGRVGLSASIGGGYSRESFALFNSDSGPESFTDHDLFEARLSVAGFLPLATGERGRLAIGLRFGMSHTHGVPFNDNDFSQTDLSLQVPLRLQWFATKQVAIHSEVGLGLRRRAIEQDSFFRAPIVQFDRKSTTWTVEDFASPVANVGVSYFF